MKSFFSVVGCLWLAVCATGCFVPSLADDAVFSCSQDADCAAEGIVCAPRTGGLSGYCCKPTAEVCNNADDNCNGVRDDVTAAPCYGGPEGTQGVGLCRAGTTGCANGAVVCNGEVRPAEQEVCNGVDDDCDGQVDEGFSLQTDVANCGTCGNVCSADIEQCVAGSCTRREETNCENGLDDDGDSFTDCADSDCANKSCGPACVCINRVRGEGVCSDGIDNDGDTETDCVDQDCVGQSCGTGCVCGGYKRTESVCDDNQDNDGDGLTDCADTADCANKACGTGCVCQSGSRFETVCNDTQDNDGDGDTDCRDLDCTNQECGLGGCICKGRLKTENTTHCNDGVDNDGDSKVDCADTPDCNGVSCGTGCVCGGGAKTELATHCNDGADNDGDGKVDCADTPDCNGAACGTGCVCGGGSRTENACGDNQDNDGDGRRDCADSDCLGKTCASGRVCNAAGSCVTP